MESAAQRLMALFSGHPGVHGTHGVPEREPGGLKWGIKKTARTLREPVTVELWQEHLAGRRPLGVVPIRDDDDCLWGSIDVDQYDANLLEMVQKAEGQKLPLVPCRSKSGGLHFFLFLSDPQPAAELQALLRDIAARLGLGGSEIFPKQTRVLKERGDLGNWMVMPYFGDTYGGKLRDQVGLKKTGAEQDVEEFLQSAKHARLSDTQFQALASRRPAVAEGAAFSDGPPCLQHMAKGGFPEGGRNNALFMIGLYHKRRRPTGWQELLEKSNREHMSPPLTSDEVADVIRSLEKRDYEYTCRNEPMASHCDSAVCRGRRFGVGDAKTFPRITSLSRLDVEPAVWFVEVDGGRVECATKELQSFVLFQAVCMEKIRVTFRVMKQSDWIALVGEAMTNCTVIDAPSDAGAAGWFHEILEAFLTDRTRGVRKEDLVAGHPWEDDETHRHYFRVRDLETHLRREGVRDLSRVAITARLRELGATHGFFNIKNTGVNWWSLPSEMFTAPPALDPPPIPRSPI